MKFCKLATISVLFVFSININAATITYEYSGSWFSTNGVDPQELDGASFDFSFSIDSNAAPTNSGDTWANYIGDASITIHGSPGDVDGVYTDNISLVVWTDFNNYGTLNFGNFNSPFISNTGNFIFLPVPKITLGLIADTSLPVGDFTGDIAGVWGTGTSGGGRYSANISNLSATVVPVPAAVWLFGSGLVGLVGFAKRKSRI